MADLPIRLADEGLQAQLGRAVDQEAKIVRAIGSLSALEGSTVRLLDVDEGIRKRELEALGARVVGSRRSADALRADLALACWPMSRRGPGQGSSPLPDDVGRRLDALVARCAGAGRIIVVEDYGRDDVTALRGGSGREQALVAWSRRDGPFLSRGFKLRVLHCWWEWPSLDEARAFLSAAFGAPGQRVGDGLRRPRLAWNVALYHRGTGEAGA